MIHPVAAHPETTDVQRVFRQVYGQAVATRGRIGDVIAGGTAGSERRESRGFAIVGITRALSAPARKSPFASRRHRQDQVGAERKGRLRQFPADPWKVGADDTAARGRFRVISVPGCGATLAPLRASKHSPMRLTAEQVNVIRRIAREEAGADSVVRLFGSRLDDTARGGDIDLLLEIPHAVDHPALFSARIAARLMRALGGRHVDVLLAAPNLDTLPIHGVAVAEGVRL